MEAPDKIFLPRNIDCPSAAILTLGNQPGDVEYIRKDVLVDKLYEWMDKDTSVTDYYSKEDFKKVIDNLF